jgi:hypothetical protein
VDLSQGREAVPMTFHTVFIGMILAFALIVGALLVNCARPSAESKQPRAALFRATGKCAECHYRQQNRSNDLLVAAGQPGALDFTFRSLG